MSGVSQSLRDGIAAAQARQFDRARPLLEQATAAEPSDPVAWFWLAIAAPSPGAAMRCLRRVLELEPTHEQARNGLVTLLQTVAQRLAAAGARAEALDLAAEATRLAPNSQSVWLSIAALTDDQKERIEALRKAVAITPDDAQLRTRLRQALLARGVMPSIDRAEARACFKEAAAINPNDPRVWQALAKLADTPAEAVDALRELVRVAPDQPHGHFALRNALAADARALTESGRTDDARARWQEIISTTNNDVEAWLGVAATTSDENEATEAIETAHRLNPTHEQVIEAKARLERSRIDPATVEAPVDAFARFDAPADVAAPADDPFAQLDSTLDAFAQLSDPVGTPAPAPTPAFGDGSARGCGAGADRGSRVCARGGRRRRDGVHRFHRPAGTDGLARLRHGDGSRSRPRQAVTSRPTSVSSRRPPALSRQPPVASRRMWRLPFRRRSRASAHRRTARRGRP